MILNPWYVSVSIRTNLGVWTICPTPPTPKRLTFNVPNEVGIHRNEGSSLSPKVLAFSCAEDWYRLAKDGAGVAGAAPRAPVGAPPAGRPPISLPRHQTPDQSGWPSGIRGTGPAAPFCVTAKPGRASQANAATAAAVTINVIHTRFMFTSLLYFACSEPNVP